MTRKRRRPSKDEQGNLKRFRDEIMHLSKPGLIDFHHDKSEFAPIRKKLSRKLERREERNMKKARKLAYNLKIPMPTVEEIKEKKKQVKMQEKKHKKSEKSKKKKKKSLERRKEKMRKEEELRQEEMNIAIEKEKKMLKQLEKQLHLNKRKNKSLPQSFVNDGLDYLLDVVDKDKVSALYNDSDLEDDIVGQSGDKNESDSNQEISDDNEFEDENEDDFIEQEKDELKEQTIKEIMSHLKTSDSKLTRDKLKTASSTEDMLKIKSALKGAKRERKTVEVRFEGDDDDADESDEKSFLEDDKDEILSDIEKDDDYDDENDLSENSDENEDRTLLQQKHLKKTDVGVEESENDDLSDSEDIDESDIDENEDRTLLQQKHLKKTDVCVEESENDDLSDSEDIDDSDIDEHVDTSLTLKANRNVQRKNQEVSDVSLKEDIYGRLRDSEGNIVTMTAGSYVPPAKRLAMGETLDEKNKLKLERLKKQLKGLINRASESNMGPINSQIQSLFTSNSRGDVNESLCAIIMEATISSVLTPERLSMELMMLVAILNHNIGMEIGGLFIQQLAHRLKESWDDLDGKVVDNIVLLFAHLYNFKVIHCVLIFDLIRKFVDRFTEKDIEIILLLLKTVGFSLRKDDPHTLKDLILLIQGKANHMKTTDSVRVKFMLEVLLAIKNNNMKKIPNYDPEKFEQIKKSTRNHIKGSLGSNQLRIGLNDLMNAENKGRWWIIGSAWEGHSDTKEEKVQSTILGEMSNKILELARKQRMNTGIRKTIFCVIMTSEDYIDAFEKLLRLGLKNLQEREIIHVITDCCLQEKSFNPFYAYLLQKFCEYDRRFQMTFQFMLWDKFKEMSHQADLSRNHLAKVVSHLLVTKSISLSVFKVVEFGTLDKNMVRFLKQVLQEILLDNPDHVIQDVFSRIAPLSKLHILHEGLKLFMRHFLIGKKSKQNKTLIDQVSLAEKSLSSGESKFEL